MSPSKKSLLDLPAEIRVRIYQCLFQIKDPTIRLHMLMDCASLAEDETAKDVFVPFGPNRTNVDEGVTLTCKLLREESMPLLRRSINLFCYIKKQYHGPISLNIRAQYLKCIRRVHLLHMGDVGMLPFHDLTSLEVIRFNCDADLPVLLEVSLHTFSGWAISSDIKSLVTAIKDDSKACFRGEEWDALLQNEARGFRIQCRDFFQCIVTDRILVGPLTNSSWLQLMLT